MMSEIPCMGDLDVVFMFVVLFWSWVYIHSGQTENDAWQP